MPKLRRRILVEECRLLDITRLNREGALVPGAVVDLRWGDDLSAQFYVTGTPEHPSRAGIIKIDGLHNVRLTWTTCQYGGDRPWFLCPNCSRRCAKLLDYRGHGFRCRQCYGAGYAVENEIPEWRIRRRIKKLEHRLGQGFERPKGMHHTTHQRLCDEAADLEMWADALFLEKVSRHFPDLLLF
jgi:hypothetical protein